MSVFSKIFIVINLLLTLLLVAATATQINLKGIYKRQYKQNHDDWMAAKHTLGVSKSDYTKQVGKLRTQATERKDLKATALEKLTAAKNAAKDKATKHGELSSEKKRLDGELQRINGEHQQRDSTIRRDRGKLSQARKRRAELWGEVQRLVQTWYALKLDLADYLEKEGN